MILEHLSERFCKPLTPSTENPALFPKSESQSDLKSKLNDLVLLRSPMQKSPWTEQSFFKGRPCLRPAFLFWPYRENWATWWPWELLKQKRLVTEFIMKSIVTPPSVNPLEKSADRSEI